MGFLLRKLESIIKATVLAVVGHIDELVCLVSCEALRTICSKRLLRIIDYTIRFLAPHAASSVREVIGVIKVFGEAVVAVARGHQEKQ